MMPISEKLYNILKIVVILTSIILMTSGCSYYKKIESTAERATRITLNKLPVIGKKMYDWLAG